MNAVTVLFAAGLCLAAYYDVARRLVPNWLNVTILIAGLGLSTRGLGDLLLSVGIALAVILPFFHFRVYRGGDAKLLIACGAWLPVLDWLVGFAVGMLLGAVYAMIQLLRDPSDRERAGRTLSLLYLSRLGTLGEERDATARTVPMALPFGVGMMLAKQVDLISMVGV